MTEGHIELARAVASIRIGHRLRGDLGDLGELVASITLLGLLQPITISPDGTLICGVRRCAAVMQLGWKTVNVWVRSGISTDLERLLAEQHENTLRKSFTPTEAARLYAELKPLYQEDAARRQAATQFRSDTQITAIAGPAKVAGPHGDARAQAAKAVTGRRSDLTLERVLEIQRLADDPGTPTHLRETAARELEEMDRDHTVHGHYLVVKALQSSGQQLATDSNHQEADQLATTTELWNLRTVESPEDLEHAAHAALARARAARRTARGTARLSNPLAARRPPAEIARFSVRAFLMTIDETDYWWVHYDPEEIGQVLTTVQWEQFDDWVTQAAAFREAVWTAAERRGLLTPHADGEP